MLKLKYIYYAIEKIREIDLLDFLGFFLTFGQNHFLPAKKSAKNQILQFF